MKKLNNLKLIFILFSFIYFIIGCKYSPSELRKLTQTEEMIPEIIDIDCNYKTTLLKQIYESDQANRINIDNYDKNLDEKDESLAVSIIENCGFPTREEVGEKGILAIFLSLQHGNFFTREKYFPMFKEAALKGEIGMSYVAMMEDRILIDKGKMQIYGTQLVKINDGKFALAPLVDPLKVNERRSEMGLGDIQSFLKKMDISFKSSSFSSDAAVKSKITLITNSDLEIDKIIFAKTSGIRDEDIWVYHDTIKIYDTLYVNNRYNVEYYVKGKRKIEQFWLRGNNITIKISVDSILTIDTIINSPFSYYTKGIYDKYYKDLMVNNYEDSTINQFLLAEIKKNLDHPFSNDLSKIFLHENQDKKENLEVLQEIIKEQNQAIKQHRSSPHNRLEKILKTNAVRLVNYEFYDAIGNIKRIDNSKDKKYILDFWFTGCPPCLKDHQIMKMKMDYLEKNNFQVIGISTDYDLDIWVDFIKQKKYPWENFRENGAAHKVLSDDLGIMSFPTYIIIDNEGEILARKESFDGVMDYLKE